MRWSCYSWNTPSKSEEAGRSSRRRSWPPWWRGRPPAPPTCASSPSTAGDARKQIINCFAWNSLSDSGSQHWMNRTRLDLTLFYDQLWCLTFPAVWPAKFWVLSSFHGRSIGCLSVTHSKAIHLLDIPLMGWPTCRYPRYKYPLVSIKVLLHFIFWWDERTLLIFS